MSVTHPDRAASGSTAVASPVIAAPNVPPSSTANRFEAQPALALVSSSIGRKLMMAVTGGALLAFLLAHVAGNLQIFEGPEKINAYGAMLREMPFLLWTARLGLLAIFLVHVLTSLQLRGINRGARTTRYEYDNTVQASFASLHMLETGIVVLLFVVIHLLHFTFGTMQPQFFHAVDAKGRHDVYAMVIHGFQNRWYVVGYLAALGALGVHLSHAVASMLHTLGFYSRYSTPIVRRLSVWFAVLVVAAYAAIPISVQLGLLVIPGAP